MADDVADRFAIRDLIENWVLWRDAGDWERFATLWRPTGRMNTSWYSAPAPDFIARSRRAFEGGLRVLHMLGGTSLELEGGRAVAQTRMQILQRAEVEGVLCDVVCYGRFWDALEKGDDGRWGLVLRQPVYELDHLIPVDPRRPPALDPARLEAFPEGYRHLAYLQTGLGFKVERALPGTRGPEIEALLARGRRWISGEGVECLV